MRTARLVGLSPDGTSLILATENGEELALPADDRLRAAVRGDRPRLGQLEIQMESTLSPREIQTRIRSGESLEDVARGAGLPVERVERFAAPVLAEREYVASTALAASVRRRGETSGHRNLRSTVAERLHGRGVDVDAVAWDSRRLDDGRWAVTADYRSGEAGRHAEFCWDPQGRYSVAGNDEARWLLGEQSSARGPQPGRRRPVGLGLGVDEEPTLDLSDDLALVRATSEPPPPEPDEDDEATEQVQGGREEAAEEDEEDAQPGPADEAVEPTVAVLRLREVEVTTEVEVAVASVAEPVAEEPDEVAETPLEVLEAMLAAEDPVEPWAGLSDASAVPEVDARDWEPAPPVEVPVEPQVEEVTAVVADPLADPEARPEPEAAASPEATEGARARTPLKGTRKRRASVPSWDEIMFGGPKRPG